MEKVYATPPWWAYLVAIGFIIFGVYLIKLWRSPLKPNASEWDKKTHIVYLIQGIAAILGGIMAIVIFIYQDCTGWIAK